MTSQSIKNFFKIIKDYSLKELSFRFFEILKIKFNNPHTISSITKIEGIDSSNDISIVLIVKNEARYIREWLEYHFLIGVDHVYIYDNDSTDGIHALLAPYIKKTLKEKGITKESIYPQEETIAKMALQRALENI